MRLFVLARHAETTLNVARVVNGDPAVDAPLTEKGRSQAELLGRQVWNVALDSCIVTRFRRTRDTAEIALAGREIPIAVEPLFGDVDVGDLEGMSLDDYRAWKLAHARAEPFPNGESLDAAAGRYGRALERLLSRPEKTILVIAHEIPIRYHSTPPRELPISTLRVTGSRTRLRTCSANDNSPTQGRVS